MEWWWKQFAAAQAGCWPWLDNKFIFMLYRNEWGLMAACSSASLNLNGLHTAWQWSAKSLNPWSAVKSCRNVGVSHLTSGLTQYFSQQSLSLDSKEEKNHLLLTILQPLPQLRWLRLCRADWPSDKCYALLIWPFPACIHNPWMEEHPSGTRLTQASCCYTVTWMFGWKGRRKTTRDEWERFPLAVLSV